MSRRDGFREATVIAATIFSFGATIVHVMDIVETGNLAPGNTLQNVSNLLRSALLIGFLMASRRAERLADSEVHTPAFEVWRQPRAQAVGAMTIAVATGFGVGFAVDLALLSSVLGIIVGAALVILIISRAPAKLS